MENTEITDPNCIVKAFQQNSISIIKDDDNKYYFRGSDVAQALGITNIRSSIQNFTDREKGVRKVDTLGGPQDTLFLTSQGVYRLLYSSKKAVAEKFREWVGDILDDIIFNESKELQHQLQLEKNKRALLQNDNDEKQRQIELLTRKKQKHIQGESLYILHCVYQDEKGNNKDVYKVGKTKNLNQRDTRHTESTFQGVVKQYSCVDSNLLEKVVHFVLERYRIARRREWFETTFDIVEKAIKYAKLVIESDINLENAFLLPKTEEFITKFVESDVNLEKTNLLVETEEKQDNEQILFSKNEYEIQDINNFEKFINDCCDIDYNRNDYSVSYKNLKNQYKIWSKTPSHAQLGKMIEYVKKIHVTFRRKHNPLVPTSKMTLNFRHIRIKPELYKFEEPDNKNLIIENFLYEKCNRAPSYRVKMCDLFDEFDEYYKNKSGEKMNYMTKEKLKNYLDNLFVRLRSGDESEKDKRQLGWLGIALKSDDNPEPILNYKPKNKKIVYQIDILTNDTIKEWPSIYETASYINKSTTVTSSLISRGTVIQLDGIQSVLKTNIK
jgi:prophage antirepressor-like protein